MTMAVSELQYSKNSRVENFASAFLVSCHLLTLRRGYITYALLSSKTLPAVVEVQSPRELIHFARCNNMISYVDWTKQRWTGSSFMCAVRKRLGLTTARLLTLGSVMEI